jgi:hypothetical protein
MGIPSNTMEGSFVLFLLFLALKALQHLHEVSLFP